MTSRPREKAVIRKWARRTWVPLRKSKPLPSVFQTDFGFEEMDTEETAQQPARRNRVVGWRGKCSRLGSSAVQASAFRNLAAVPQLR
jgi:hypothetical protein